MFTKLTKDQLKKKTEYINSYIGAINAASGSEFDPNANVTSKNVATLNPDIFKDFNVQLKRYLISDRIEKMYGKEVADEYNRQIEAHEIYVHDESHAVYPYCCSVTMYPFILNGLTTLGGEAKAPKHLESYCGNFINLVFCLASQFAGAVATTEWLNFFDYYARKDFGDNYLETHSKYIKDKFQQVVYSLNQPAGARSYQCPFWNISIFDKYFFDGLFGDFIFPDEEMSRPNYESVAKLQKFFMEWFNKEREVALLTFPVVTAASLTENGKCKDEEFNDFLCEQMSKGNSFFNYMSDSVDSLSSCCFAGDQKVLVRYGDNKTGAVFYERFDTLGRTKDGCDRKKFLVFHNGSWVKGKLIDLPARNMYKISTVNGHQIVVSDNHLNPCLRGDVQTTDLTTDDYLLYNTRPLNAYPEQDQHLTFEQGYLVGAFLGDGSFGRRTPNGIYEIDFSLNKTSKLARSVENFKRVLQQFDLDANVNVCLGPNELVPVRISSKVLVDFIQYWTNWKEGTYAPTKELNLNCLLQSVEFRKGILAGWYDTDGGNSNRCYTTSPILAEHMVALISSLGMVSNVSVADRTGEIAFVENGKEYIRNYPLHCVRWYNPLNKRKMKDVFVVRNNSVYMKIKSIEPVNYEGRIYCFDMENNDEPYFTLPNGIITHNCRLRNELQDNTFSFSLGAGGTQAGSINVITLNFNRLTQNADREGIPLSEKLEKQLDLIYKYQSATYDYFKSLLKSKMLPAYDSGFIDMKKQYLTVGINGMLEAAEYKGLTAGNNPEYIKFLQDNLKIIYKCDKEARQKYGIITNCEFVPAENLGVKNYHWDLKDGYVVNPKRNCYNSYFYPPEASEDECNIADKFVLHGKEVIQYLDGGSALHLNLEEYPTFEGYKRLFELAAKTGCNYWTTNIAVTCCEDCGYITKKTQHHCHRCKSKNVTWATRIIGYLRKINNFSEGRQLEASMRHYHKIHPNK